tara:strand:+ start:77594 stop:78202 length:609 start_codon:yes stop_codon:yes gene_type:complete
MPSIVQEFKVNQTVDNVWQFLQNVPEVVSCIPGFILTDHDNNNHYRGKVNIRLGPIVGSFEGEATIIETDAIQRITKIEGQGLDRQGGSRASATVSYEVKESGDHSIVKINADMKLTGTLAQMGRTGIVQDVADQVTNTFAKNLNDKIAKNADGRDTEELGNIPSKNPHSGNKQISSELKVDKILFKIIIRFLKRLLGISQK